MKSVKQIGKRGKFLRTIAFVAHTSGHRSQPVILYRIHYGADRGRNRPPYPSG